MLALLGLVPLLLLPPIYSAPVDDLRQCIGSSIAVYTAEQFNFVQLQSWSFKNNLVTPLAIAQASTEEQVASLVRCARNSSVRVCARSGGHSLIGANLCKGLVIDLSNMRKVTLQSDFVADVQPGAVLGEVLWTLHQQRRWIAGGVCPSVGFAGYILGGGHGPYEGKLGLACDSLLSLRMVDRFGQVLSVSRESRPELFWAMCGAGGGQFGIATSFRMTTAPSDPFDRGVVFRFNWPRERGGELLEKWQEYGEWAGGVWFRMEVYLEDDERGVIGYGACYDVAGEDECMSRLEQAWFFKTEGRKTSYMANVTNALDLHAFFGPLGGWGRRRVPDLNQAFLMQRGSEQGGANWRTYQSTFLDWGERKPTRAYWQKYVDFCQKPAGGDTIPWVVCEMNLFNNAIDRPVDNSFAHRGAKVITHYIVGGGSAEAQRRAYRWMRNHFKKFRVGVYVNYPELELKKYARLYWGNQLDRLKQVKQVYDPENFFMNPQKIP